MEYIPKFQKGKKLPELPLFNSDPQAFVDSVLTANKDLEWVERLWPTVRRSNSIDNIIPGQHSSHLMSHDGQGYVFPKIVKDVDTKKLRYLPTDDEAREYALRTNTGIKFETPEQADWFTKNYKIGTGVFGKNPKPSLMFEEGGKLPKLQSGKKLPELETYRKFEASADNTKTVAANNKVQQSNNLKRAADIRQRREDMKPPTSNVPTSERLLTNLKNLGNIVYESGKPLLLAGTAGMASMAPYGSSLASVAKSMLAGTAVDQMYHDFGGQNLGDAANIQNPTGRFIANMVSPGGAVGYNAGLKTAQRLSNVRKLNRVEKGLDLDYLNKLNLRMGPYAYWNPKDMTGNILRLPYELPLRALKSVELAAAKRYPKLSNKAGDLTKQYQDKVGPLLSEGMVKLHNLPYNLNKNMGEGGHGAVYKNKDFPHLLTKLGRLPDFETPQSVEHIKNTVLDLGFQDNVAYPIKTNIKNYRVSQLINKVPGRPRMNFNRTSDEQWEDLFRRVEALRSRGVEVDFKNPENFLADINGNVSIVDLNTTPPDWHMFYTGVNYADADTQYRNHLLKNLLLRNNLGSEALPKEKLGALQKMILGWQKRNKSVDTRTFELLKGSKPANNPAPFNFQVPRSNAAQSPDYPY